MKLSTVRGFVTLLSVAVMGIVSVIANANDTAAEHRDQVVNDAKANAREAKRKAKKTVRDASGNGSTVKDAKDKAEVMKDNAKDDLDSAKKKLND